MFVLLANTPRYMPVFENYEPVVKNFVPCMIRVFNAVEKTKMSYYDIRFQLKFELREPIMDLFNMM